MSLGGLGVFGRTCIAAILVAGSTGSVARADEAPEENAKRLYNDAAKAYDERDFSKAATGFMKADFLAPNPMVLKLALAAAIQADDPAIAMTLALRAESRSVDGSLADLARQARVRYEKKVGVVRVRCLDRKGCVARNGDTEAGDGELFASSPGSVKIEFQSSHGTTASSIVVLGGATMDVEEPRPAAPKTVESSPGITPTLATVKDGNSPSNGLPKAVFWGGAGFTALLGGITVVSAMDTGSLHDEFRSSKTADLQSRGEAAQLRTNVLIGVTIGSAVLTSVVGLFFTNWKGVSSEKGAWKPNLLTF